MTSQLHHDATPFLCTRMAVRRRGSSARGTSAICQA